ncbi:MAG TPA: elongation factor P maturation arginine rhamnosyltransferase EarP [Ramlibacter sp.]|nr:elongation factor P maturation arginine rhamnosyltransferase EarP [Ramlibacter sp.]
MRWDIFCKVIDNHGDIGVCWRLAAELAARGEDVRLWVDDPSALAWMAPRGRTGVEVRHWNAPADDLPGDVVVEAFACDLDDSFVARIAQRTRTAGAQPVWLNLEYLSAEGFVERNHGLPSPVLTGPGQGLVKHFFYPGFTPRTGGLLRERDLDARQHAFDRTGWLGRRGIACDGRRLVSLFCYEPPALPQWLEQLAQGTDRTHLLVTAGRPTAAVREALGPAPDGRGALSVSYLPLLSQRDYDHLLWACDLNFVRGEDSLVRALWAGRPFVWHTYPQEDGAHHAKLRAFLGWLQAPASLRAFHEAWSGLVEQPLPALELDAWAAAATLARDRLAAQQDLATQLLGFVRKTG